jgi:hypothetical protein
MESEHPNWKESACLLAGGDASYISADIRSISTYGYGFFGVGPCDIDYWKNLTGKKLDSFKAGALAAGGGHDWRPGNLTDNVRTEVMHLMLMMNIALTHKLPIFYSTDLMDSVKGFQQVHRWSQTKWLSACNRDLWEAIKHLKIELFKAKVRFEVFHNKGHPENWADRKDYNALEWVAHHSDLLADQARICVPPVICSRASG